ncbi:MAG: hypothetical protein ACOC22_02380 [bacterium]
MDFKNKILKKKDITEIINSYGEIIGGNNMPSSGADLESQANNTTDYNAKVHAQPFRYDMLGRFGFTMMPFFESDDEENNVDDENLPILKDLAELMYEKFKDHLRYYFKHPHRLKSDYRVHNEATFDSQPEQNRETDYEWAKKIIAILHPYLNSEKTEKTDEVLNTKSIDKSQKGSIAVNGDMNEDIVNEKVLKKKDEDELTNKTEDNEVRSKKIKKIAGLINKLDKKDVDDLINLLEKK